MLRPPRQKTEKLQKPKIGKPSVYSDVLGIEICERMAHGESLRSICRDPSMPEKRSVFRWLLNQPEFRDRYTLARELRADVYFDEIIDIADDPTGDLIEKNGKKIVDWENVQRSRLKVDARKWICARMNPKKYGERVISQLTGHSDGAVTIDVTPQRLLPAELANEFNRTLDKIEKEMGLPMNIQATPAARVKAILDTGSPVPPELYSILQERSGNA